MVLITYDASIDPRLRPAWHQDLIKFGGPEGPDVRPFSERGAKTLVHAVFDGRTPHGDVFARIAPCVPGGGPCVPHIVPRRQATGPDLRHELGIPADATVFGRHGGRDVFDVPEARQAVLRVARDRPDTYFLFMNTDPIGDPSSTDCMHNIIYLPRTLDEARKAAFIRSCDAMLHGRRSGESFGLAVAEFSAHNR